MSVLAIKVIRSTTLTLLRSLDEVTKCSTLSQGPKSPTSVVLVLFIVIIIIIVVEMTTRHVARINRTKLKLSPFNCISSLISLEDKFAFMKSAVIEWSEVEAVQELAYTKLTRCKSDENNSKNYNLIK